jgi:hypothetical protein
MRELAHYTPEDGPYIHILALLRAFPEISSTVWIARVTGTGASNGYKPVKAPPLLGRVHASRVVILAGSFSEWLARYRWSMQAEHRAAMVADLVRDSARIEAEKKERTAEQRAAGKLEAPGRKAAEKPPKAHAARAKAEISRDVFSVWR